jgi:hypothetical protein
VKRSSPKCLSCRCRRLAIVASPRMKRRHCCTILPARRQRATSAAADVRKPRENDVRAPNIGMRSAADDLHRARARRAAAAMSRVRKIVGVRYNALVLYRCDCVLFVEERRRYACDYQFNR